MATLTYYSGFSFPSGSKTIQGGNRSGGYSITVDGLHERLYKSLATATTWEAWEASDENTSVTNFDFLWMISDQNVFIELTCDKGGEVGTVVFACEVQANIPFVLSSDDAYALYTANFATGSEDLIDRLRVRNVSGSTALVEIHLVT